MNVVILIPAYKPDEKFVKFFKCLRDNSLSVVAVDDGSGEEYQGLFKEAEECGITVVHHEVNRGKGAALRTGFAYIKDNMPEVKGIVTADCDGQHTPKDLMRVIEAMEQNPDAMIIGGRFSKKQDKVPLRSMVGNTITRWAFRLATGLKVRDTQTGLRGVPASLIPNLLEVKGDRYEYEMNMLLYLRDWDVPYKEIPIDTIYINNNETSHYNTWRDSFRIYTQILKYCAASAISVIVDFVLFTVLHVFVFKDGGWNFSDLVGDGVPSWIVETLATFSLAYIVARIVSATLNYVLNRKVVFKKGGKYSWLKYTVLAIAVMLVGAFGTGLFFRLWGIPGIICKLIIDLPLALLNYFVQREWVFKK